MNTVMARNLVWSCVRQLRIKSQHSVTLMPIVSWEANLIRLSVARYRKIPSSSIHTNSFKHDDYNNELVSLGTDSGNKPAGKKVAKGAKNLEDILNLSSTVALNFVNEHKAFLKMNGNVLRYNYRFCIESGLRRETIIDNIQMLAMESKMLVQKMNIIKKMNIDINIAAPFLILDPRKLYMISKVMEKEAVYIPGGNRINYLVDKLQCNHSEVVDVMVKYPFLETVPFDRFQPILTSLLENGVSSKDILKDVWVFRYNPETAQNRLKQAREAGVTPIKPWVVRCPEKVFQNAVERQQSRRTLLGQHSTIVEYLSQRLECDANTVKWMIERHPQITGINMQKVTELIDFLYEEGYKPDHIRRVPRILLHSVETIKERLMQMREIGHRPRSIIVFCKSKKDYSLYLKHLMNREKTLQMVI